MLAVNCCPQPLHPCPAAFPRDDMTPLTSTPFHIVNVDGDTKLCLEIVYLEDNSPVEL
jgi:hypothetical protein